MAGCKHLASYIATSRNLQVCSKRFLSGGEPENTVTFPRSINYRNQIIYFDPKKTSRIVIKKILNYYHHGEKCGKLLVGMSEKSKRVSENPRRHTTVCSTSDRYQQSLLLFTGVSVNLEKYPGTSSLV